MHVSFQADDLDSTVSTPHQPSNITFPRSPILYIFFLSHCTMRLLGIVRKHSMLHLLPFYPTVLYKAMDWIIPKCPFVYIS